MPSPSIMFVAGDPSGDVHASHVVRELKGRTPDLECFGVGGPAMAEAGLTQLLPFDKFCCMGFTEVLRSLPFLLSAKRSLVNAMAEHKPSAVVLVDYAGFNIPMMKAAHTQAVPVVWYIAPKVWAWREKRAAVLARYASVIATIFPFETTYFEGSSARVEFVGNPVVEALDRDGGPRADLLHFKPRTFFRLALVPGSRKQEVKRMLGPMLGAYQLMRRSYRQFRASVSRCPWLPEGLYDQCYEVSGVDICEAPLGDQLAACDAALVTSGTATLEAALRGIPHVIAYKTSPLSYRLGKSLVKIDRIGLPNIVAGEKILPECIQEGAGSAYLASELEQMIGAPEKYEAVVRRLLSLREELGSKRPSIEVTNLILEAAGLS